MHPQDEENTMAKQGMPKDPETAVLRRAREAAEARAAAEAWEREKPARLLRALARAHDLGVDAYVHTRYDNVMYYVL